MTVIDIDRPPVVVAERIRDDVEPVRVPKAWIERRPRRTGLWWLAPAGVLLLVIPLSLLVAMRISDADYRYFYKAPRVLTTADALLFLAGMGVLILGTLVPLALRSIRVPREWPALPLPQRDVLGRAEPVAFWLTAGGYLALLALGVARGATPSVLLGAVVSQDNYTGQLKTLFAPVAGLSSFTQVGIAYVVIASVLLTQDPGAQRTRLLRRLVIVVVLGLLRSYLLTERLAVLELIVPIVVVAATRRRAVARRSNWITLAPLLALPLLLVVFGAFEYSRSWVYFRTRTALSFPEFVVNRLAGYYATSYNNGALQLAHGHAANRLPFDSIQGLWTAPGIAQSQLYFRLTGQQGNDLLNVVLAQNGNPEFNNPGGLSAPFVDFGTVGGLGYFLIAGVVIGCAYRGFRSGSPAGLLMYPVLFTGLLELPRYVYWTQGRVVPSAVVLLVTAALMARSMRGRSGVAT